MKIAFVTNSFSAAFRGGAEIQMENYIESLRNLGHHVEVIAHDNASEILSFDIIHFFRIEESFLSLALFLREKKKPIVISPIIFPDNFWVELYYKIGGYLERTPLGKFFIISQKIALLRNMDMIYPNTQEEANQLQRMSKDLKLSVVPNCAENIFFTYAESSEVDFIKFSGLKSNEYILNVGRIEPRKNQLRLIKACASLQIPIVLIGSIRDDKYWQKCKSIGGQKLIHIPFIDDKRLLISAYQNCRLFALPSTMETPGISAIEAVSCGAKVVITDRGGTKSHFKNQVLYCNPFSVKSINRSIVKALFGGDKVLTEMNIVTYADVAAMYEHSYNTLIND